MLNHGSPQFQYGVQGLLGYKSKQKKLNLHAAKGEVKRRTCEVKSQWWDDKAKDI